MPLSVKELLSPAFPYLALSASLSPANIPPFPIYHCCLPTFLWWCFFSYANTFADGRLPDVIQTSVCSVLDYSLLLHFCNPPFGQD